MHCLILAKDNLRHEVIVQQVEHDCLVNMPVSPTAESSILNCQAIGKPV